METTKFEEEPGRQALAIAVAACFAAGSAFANPTGPSVVSGTAAFQQAGSVLQITNSPSSIINWQSFSIGANEITRFIQQSQASAVLNRVTGNAGMIDPSVILGALQSNGRVFLINPSGILFGSGAQIDVAGLVATSLNLSNADFLAGRMNFTAMPNAGSIVNQGNITTAPGGNVYLVGPAVTNSGIITSPKGEVVLAASNSVELVDPGTPNLRVEITAPDNEARNLGRIIAESGRIGIYAGLINHSGLLQADTVELGKHGEIRLKASRNITLQSGSTISASGAAGGIHNGGVVQVIAEDTLEMRRGSLVRVEGADAGGNGGLLELSGHRRLLLEGSYSGRALASGYRAGSLLLDPTNTDITTGACVVDTCIDPTTAFLGFGGITVSTTNELRVLSTIANDKLDPGASLTLSAGDDLIINAGIWNFIPGFDHDVSLSAGRDIVLASGTGISLAGSRALSVIAGNDIRMVGDFIRLATDSGPQVITAGRDLKLIGLFTDIFTFRGTQEIVAGRDIVVSGPAAKVWLYWAGGNQRIRAGSNLVVNGRADIELGPDGDEAGNRTIDVGNNLVLSDATITARFGSTDLINVGQDFILERGAGPTGVSGGDQTFNIGGNFLVPSSPIVGGAGITGRSQTFNIGNDLLMTGNSGISSSGSMQTFNVGGAFSLLAGAGLVQIINFNGPQRFNTGGDVVLIGGPSLFNLTTIHGISQVGMTVNGVIQIVGGSGQASWAQIGGIGPGSVVNINFPSRSSGGYFVNGVEGVVYDTATNSGFIAGGMPGTLGTNLFFSYGLPSASGNNLGTLVGETSAQVFAATSMQAMLNNPMSIDRDVTRNGPASDKRNSIAMCN